MSKHTPGPWLSEPHEGIPEGFSIVTAEKRVSALDNPGESPDEQLVADVFRTFDFDSSSEANARLIAAAPDLLEALKYVLVTCADSNGMYCISGKADAKIRLAIAKADGK